MKEQNELSNSLNTTTARYQQLSDPSILSDLLNSHLKQLQVMLENLNKCEDIRRRCIKAKEELINNLNIRLKWVLMTNDKNNNAVGNLTFVSFNHDLFHTGDDGSEIN